MSIQCGVRAVKYREGEDKPDTINLCYLSRGQTLVGKGASMMHRRGQLQQPLYLILTSDSVLSSGWVTHGNVG